jgi:hypothetical protein
MHRLMIRCPATQQLIPTGVSIDEASFQTPENTLGINRVRCPHCQSMHRWSYADAVFEPKTSSRNA